MQHQIRTILALLAIGAVVLFIFGSRIPTTETNRFLDYVAKNDRPDLVAERDFLMTMNPKLGRPTPENLFPIYQKIQGQKKIGLRSVPNGSENWESRGPDNVGGRTRAILVDMRDTTGNTVWAGSVSGGLWKTTNFLSSDASWQPIDDFFPSLSISAIVQDPDNPERMYFSTGETYNERIVVGTSSVSQGFGLWESLDGGDTWNVFRNDFAQLNYGYDLEIDVNGDLYYGTNNGLFKFFKEGGWQYVLGSLVPEVDAFIVSDLENSSDGTLYATIHGSLSNGASGQIFKSSGENLGNRGNWTEITPDPSNVYYRIEIDIAPSNPNRIIALCQELGSTDVTHIFRSDNAGESWQPLPVPTIVDLEADSLDRPVFTRAQAVYNLIARFDPNDPDIIYIGGIDLCRSTDAGQSWQQISVWALSRAERGEGFVSGNVVHADQHVIEFLGGNSSQAIFGNDGGIYYSEDLDQTERNPIFIEKNGGYLVTQYYACAANDFVETEFLLAGAQDNGTHGFLEEGLNDENVWFGGDGGYCFFAQDDRTSIFSNQFANVYSWNPETEEFTIILNEDDFGRFINPIDYDPEWDVLITPKNENFVYTITGASTTEPVKDSIAFSFGFIPFQVTVSPFNTDLDNYNVFVAALDGRQVKVYRIENALGNAPNVIDISGEQLPAGYASSLRIGENDSTIIVTYSNYGVESVWRTTDDGQNWKNVEGDLPDFPVRWSQTDPAIPNKVYLATEMGVWFTNDINAENVDWEQDKTGLPNVRVDMLRLRTRDNTLLAATHGRGLFSRVLSTPTCSTLQVTASVVQPDCTGQDGSIRLQVEGANGDFTYAWSNEATTDSLTLPAGDYSVTVTDAIGCVFTNTYTISEPDSIGAEFSLTEGLTSSVTAQVSGGTPPYTYQWSNGSITETASDLRADTYTLTIIDANGCIALFNIEVTTTANCPSVSIIAELQNISCFDANDASIQVEVDSAHGQISYLWSTGDTTSFLANPAPGSYSITVTDAARCEVVERFNIREPDPILIDFADSIDTTSTLTAIVMGGTPPYNYEWSNGATTSTISELVAGDYEVTITDAQGCQGVSSIAVTTTTSTVAPALASEITIFPNPTHDFLRIQMQEHTDLQRIEIYNMAGQNQLHHRIASPRFQIDVRNFESGVYLIRFIDEGREFTTMFVKQ